MVSDIEKRAMVGMRRNFTGFYGQFLAFYKVASEISPKFPRLLDSHGWLFTIMKSRGQFLSTEERLVYNDGVVQGLYAFTDEGRSAPRDVMAGEADFSKDPEFRSDLRLNVWRDGGVFHVFGTNASSELKRAVAFTLYDIQRHLGLSHDQASLLFRSQLTIAVSAFEVLIARLIQTHIWRYPESIGNSTVDLKAADILTASDIENLYSRVTDRFIDSLMRESMDDWEKWFKKQYSVEFKELALDLPIVREIFARRNLVVHTDCVVSEQYIRDVPTQSRADVSVGDVLRVTEEYLLSALDQLFAFGIAASLCVARKILSNEHFEEFCDQLTEYHLELIDLGRFEVAEDFARRTAAIGASESIRMPSKVNAWIAKAKRLGLESIRLEVQRWDVSASVEDYRVAKLVLLDDVSAAQDGIRGLIAADRWTLYDLYSWPLFSWMREAGALDEWLKVAASGQAESALGTDDIKDIIEEKSAADEDDGTS